MSRDMMAMIWCLAFQQISISGRSELHTVPVTADNFVRAESDLYFGAVVKKDGLGKLEHNREALPIDKQTVISSKPQSL
jgi:hypothetical protein